MAWANTVITSKVPSVTINAKCPALTLVYTCFICHHCLSWALTLSSVGTVYIYHYLFHSIRFSLFHSWAQTFPRLCVFVVTFFSFWLKAILAYLSRIYTVFPTCCIPCMLICTSTCSGRKVFYVAMHPIIFSSQ